MLGFFLKMFFDCVRMKNAIFRCVLTQNLQKKTVCVFEIALIKQNEFALFYLHENGKVQIELVLQAKYKQHGVCF